MAWGAFYENLDQITEEEVLFYLNKWRKETLKVS